MVKRVSARADRSRPPGDRDESAPKTKEEWRRHVVATRKSVDPQQRSAECTALAAKVHALGRPGSTVCAYVPVGSEPGSIAMLDELLAVGARVLLPIAREPGPLRWAAYTGPADLVSAQYGLREPSGPVLDSAEIGTASVVLVPALAVDRHGGRLGRGAGFYDRTLGAADPAALLVAIVRDDDIVPELPTDPHDKPMTHALTPLTGLVQLGVSLRTE